MLFHEIFQPFIEESAVSVMFRGTLENVLSKENLDEIFEQTAQRQYQKELLFSTCVDLMSLVVTKTRKSVNAAYRARREQIAVSVNSVYNKLACIEPRVCERIVRDTASDLTKVIRHLKAELPSPLPDYDVRILDGNHLGGTQHRIGELRRLGAAVLPGISLAILDPQCQQIEHVVLCEDGHASERPLVAEVLPHVQAGQCWMGDRNFCTRELLFGVSDANAFFLVRQHGNLHGESLGRRQKIGGGRTGTVYEQGMRIMYQGWELEIRRITVQRDQPTEKGETEIHFLTNLPAEVDAMTASEAYRDRWRIETAFQELTTVLRCELNTLGYPDAALFGFSVAVVMFNALSTMKAALRSAAGGSEKLERNLSSYYLADEISGVWRGMSIAIPEEHWESAFASLRPAELAKALLWLAKRVDLQMFYTNPWSPKKPPPKKISGGRGNHVSTQQTLQHRVPARKS